MSDSRQAHYYTAMQQDFGPLRIWLGRLRLLTGAQRCALLAPAVAVVTGALLGALLLSPERPQVGWLSTGGVDLRAFALEPGQLRLARDERGPRLTLDAKSVFVKYSQSDAAQQVQVHTPHTTVVARDAVFFTEVDGASTKIGVQRGEVVLFSADQHATFVGPGEQILVAGNQPQRERRTHRHFSFLELLFPRPGEVSFDQAATESAPVERVTSGDVAALEEPVTAARRPPSKRARATRATTSPHRRGGLLPRKQRLAAPPAAQLPAVAPRTAYDDQRADDQRADDQRADDQLGAPIIVTIEGAPPAPPLETEPRDQAPSVFQPPASWWR